MMSYPVASPINAANPNINQQGNVQNTYVFNQGTNNQTNQVVYTPPTNKDRLQASAPPPSYDEIFENPNKS